MADLNPNLTPLSLVKEHFYANNFRSEPQSGASKKRRRTILKTAFWHLRVKLRPCFLGGRVGRVGSAVCFFVLILNNAPALRAGNNLLNVILRHERENMFLVTEEL